MTLKELAKKIGKSPGFLSDCKRGNKSMGVDTSKAMEKATGVAWQHWLLPEDAPRNPWIVWKEEQKKKKARNRLIERINAVIPDGEEMGQNGGQSRIVNFINLLPGCHIDKRPQGRRSGGVGKLDLTGYFTWAFADKSLSLPPIYVEIEVKTKSTGPTQAQDERLSLLKNDGAKCGVARSIIDALDIMGYDVDEVVEYLIERNDA